MRPPFRGGPDMMMGPALAIGFLVLLAIAVAVGVWWLIRRRKAVKAGFGPHPPWPPGAGPHPGAGQVPPVPQPVSAVQILDERLARGDIDVDDYLTRRAALLGDRPPNGAEFQHERAGAPTDPDNPV